MTGRYEEVHRFHEQLVANRRSHLESEITAARQRIARREPLREQIEARRRDITLYLLARAARQMNYCGSATNCPAASPSSNS